MERDVIGNKYFKLLKNVTITSKYFIKIFLLIIFYSFLIFGSLCSFIILAKLYPEIAQKYFLIFINIIDILINLIVLAIAILLISVFITLIIELRENLKKKQEERRQEFINSLTQQILKGQKRKK